MVVVGFVAVAGLAGGAGVCDGDMVGVVVAVVIIVNALRVAVGWCGLVVVGFLLFWFVPWLLVWLLLDCLRKFLRGALGLLRSMCAFVVGNS